MSKEKQDFKIICKDVCGVQFASIKSICTAQNILVIIIAL